MAGRLLLLIIGLPILELWLLIEVGTIIGALWTIILIIATTIIGGQLVRQQGLGVMKRVREQQQRGEAPAIPMLEGLALLIAGFCLILPGLITDTIGFALLIPPLRKWAAERLLVRAISVQSAGNGSVYTVFSNHSGGYAPQRGPSRRASRDKNPNSSVIEGDYERQDDDR